MFCLEVDSASVQRQMKQRAQSVKCTHLLVGNVDCITGKDLVSHARVDSLDLDRQRVEATTHLLNRERGVLIVEDKPAVAGSLVRSAHCRR